MVLNMSCETREFRLVLRCTIKDFGRAIIHLRNRLLVTAPCCFILSPRPLYCMGVLSSYLGSLLFIFAHRYFSKFSIMRHKIVPDESESINDTCQFYCLCWVAILLPPVSAFLSTICTDCGALHRHAAFLSARTIARVYIISPSFLALLEHRNFNGQPCQHDQVGVRTLVSSRILFCLLRYIQPCTWDLQEHRTMFSPLSTLNETIWTGDVDPRSRTQSLHMKGIQNVRVYHDWKN